MRLSTELIDVVIAEVKANQPCTLNGPWTTPELQNVQRVLAAIGCIPQMEIRDAAENIYSTGFHRSHSGLRVRLVAVGTRRDGAMTTRYPDVTQLIWAELLPFIFARHRKYWRQKKQVDQWDRTGRALHRLAGRHHNPDGFTDEVRSLIAAFVAQGRR